MKLVIIIAMAVVLLIPTTVFADHATTYKEHWDSLCQNDFDRKMVVTGGDGYDFHFDLLQKCKNSYNPPTSEIILDDSLIHNFCDLSCIPDNYKQGENRIEDKNVLVCLDKWWREKSLIAKECTALPEFEEMNSKYVELIELWSTPVVPEFYPMEPFFKQFTADDISCLVEFDYTKCVSENGRPLVENTIGYQDAWVTLYQGCHNTARNLLASGELTNAEAGYVFEVCKPYATHLIELGTVSSYSIGDGTFSGDTGLIISPQSESFEKSEIICGTGTIEKDGMCVVDTSIQTEKQVVSEEKSSKGGGCLIATATYGSELAPQVQQLRELRDNQLLNTESGTAFMTGFNQIYYSFSPIISDLERENPIFKEMVKVIITPMISSLSILNYVEMDSEESVLGYGILLIILNGMMYVGIPILAVMRFKK
jgi:hypothetical protein